MKLIYFSQFYTPEAIAPSFRATENAELWSDMGNDVTVFTGFPNYPTGKIFDGYQVKLLEEEKINGVRVLRSKLVAVPNTSTIRRLQNALSFSFFGVWNVLFNQKKIGKDYDVVLGTSGPIFAALTGWFFAAVHRLPFAFELRDITYRQMMATGDGKMGIGARVMKYLELFLCKRAKKIVVVTNGFKTILEEDGIPSEKIDVITNGVDVNRSPRPENKKLILSYFGTLGISQNIMYTMSYAEEISKFCQDFQYLIIGEGAQRELISNEIRNQNLSFATMMRGMPMSELEQYYTQTMLSVITLKKSDNFRYTLPSKLFQVMGRGIAVLFIGPEGEASEIVRNNCTGIALTGSAEEDMEMLRNFFGREDWQQKLITMGQNGAELVAEKYSRKNLAKEYERVLLSCIK